MATTVPFMQITFTTLSDRIQQIKSFPRYISPVCAKKHSQLTRKSPFRTSTIILLHRLLWRHRSQHPSGPPHTRKVSHHTKSNRAEITNGNQGNYCPHPRKKAITATMTTNDRRERVDWPFRDIIFAHSLSKLLHRNCQYSLKARHCYRTDNRRLPLNVSIMPPSSNSVEQTGPEQFRVL